MKIEHLKWRNFTSWGNSWQEMEFGEDSSLNLIAGPNGSGKSSISNLVTYMLYGQLEDFTLKQIPNRVNKNMEGYITVSNRGKRVVVHRGLNPGIFEVFVDGKLVETAGKANVQSYLENEIYGVPYVLFKNSIALSADDFKSFIKMTPNDKREIIDRLFGYEALNEMTRKVKDKIKEIKSEYDDLSSKIRGYNESIVSVNARIDAIREKEKDSGETEKARKENEEQVLLCENAIAKIEEKANAISEKRKDKYNEENGIRVKYANASSEAMNVKRQLDLYENKRCPTCGARLDDEEHEALKFQLEESYKLALAKAENARNELDAMNTYISELDAKLELAKSKSNAARTKLYELQRSLDSMDTNLSKQVDDLLAVVDDITKKIEPAEKRKAVCDRNLEYLNIVLGVFSENGVKKYISNIYIPVINKYVEELREKLGIGCRIVFDSNYNCKLFALGEEISYKTMSKGERKKSDIAVTLAFLKILKTKINDINLLFLDEVLSGIDVASCNTLLGIFKDFSKELGLNMFVVHHANLENSIVDKVLEIKKQNGFSHFVE